VKSYNPKKSVIQNQDVWGEYKMKTYRGEDAKHRVSTIIFSHHKGLFAQCIK